MQRLVTLSVKYCKLLVLLPITLMVSAIKDLTSEAIYFTEKWVPISLTPSEIAIY